MNKDLFLKLLDFYHISKTDYEILTRPVDETNFAFSHSFNEIERVNKLVHEVVSNGGKIFIYGDYDADGIMGTSILVKMFSYINYKVGYYIPSRYIDGYGLTLTKAKEWVNQGASLVITVDNGISTFEPIDYLRENNVKVVVMDHHTIPSETVKANFILHPQYSSFGNVATSGSFVAFMFSTIFLDYFDNYLSTLAGISLISDMMPLLEYNRDLLRLVISNYKSKNYLPIDLLKDGDDFNENTIGMKIAPKINAVGRMVENDEVNKLVEFFTSEDKELLYEYSEWIHDINDQRKQLTKDAVDSLSISTLEDKGIIIVSHYKSGLSGLIANFLINKYHVPVIVFVENNNDELVGSARAPLGFNVFDCFESLKQYMVAYGGHAQAGGCTIKKEDLSNFKSDFLKICNNKPFVKPEEVIIPLKLVDINGESLETIESFSPFGENWPKPIFSIKNIPTKSLTYSKNYEHIITRIGFSAKITGFNISRSSLAGLNFIDVNGSLRSGSYNGSSYTEFLIRDVINKEEC